MPDEENKTNEMSEFVKELLEHAQEGIPGAQYELAERYRRGSDAPQDYKEAAKWFLCAAKKGNRESQYELGKLYAEGLGVEKDIQKALRWLKRAGKSGDNRHALEYLAQMYENGEGVRRSLKTAIKWHQLAEEVGSSRATERLKTLAKEHPELSQLIARPPAPQMIYKIHQGSEVEEPGRATITNRLGLPDGPKKTPLFLAGAPSLCRRRKSLNLRLLAPRTKTPRTT